MPFKKGVSGNPNGRPVGTVSIHSKASIKKLQDMGCDPIVEMHRMYEEAVEDGNTDLAFKIMNRLIDFGYSKQPAVVEQTIEQTVIPTLMIGERPKEPKDDDDKSD